MRPAIERRTATAEVRAAGRKLQGYAAVFGTDARLGSFVETIAPAAFRATLADGTDKLALVDHDPARLLARTRSNTLRLSEDSHGLAFEIDVPETQTGRDVLALAERGDLGGMSFGFKVRPGGDRWDGKRRELRAVQLVEISVVQAWPAYQGTTVAARSLVSPAQMRLRAFLEARQ